VFNHRPRDLTGPNNTALARGFEGVEGVDWARELYSNSPLAVAGGNQTIDTFLEGRGEESRFGAKKEMLFGGRKLRGNHSRPEDLSVDLMGGRVRGRNDPATATRSPLQQVILCFFLFL
jgi:hypothetical protein